MRRVAFLALAVSCIGSPVFAQAPIDYRLSFPEPEHHWMQVEVTFRELPNQPLELRMSRSSPGRYALHEFAKNVYREECLGQKQQFEDPSAVPRISQAEFKKLLETGKIVVVDVRSARSYNEGHIPGAISIPIDEVDLDVGRFKSFKEPIVTYCT